MTRQSLGNHRVRNTLGLALVVIAVAAVLVWRSDRRQASVQPSAPAVAMTDWSTLVPSLTPVLAAAFPDESVGQRGPVAIEEQSDLTGDGIPEAMVDMGSGGASTEQYALMRIQDGTPVAAAFQSQDGSTGPVIFLRGAAAAHTDDFGLLPDDHEIYAISTELDPETGAPSTCTAEAYLWHPGTLQFLYSADRSHAVESQLCPAGSAPETN